MKFLLVEDDAEIVEFISLAIDLGWPDPQIVYANQGEGIQQLVERERPDLILLDLGLPGISGFEVLKIIRQHTNIPIIIITVSDSEESIVKGLSLGADEYIVKPFGQLELLARIKAVLRNRNSQYSTPLAAGPLIYFPDSCRLKCGEKYIHLTRTESIIINELINNQGKLVSYEKLADTIWGSYYPNASDAIRVHIRRLRSKIESEPGCSGLITCNPGLGYILDAYGPK